MTTILIAEEEPWVRRSLALSLTANGYDTHAVGSTPAALELAETGSFDMVILDAGLEGFDGAVMHRFRAGGGPVPVLILIAGGDGTDAAMSEDADDTVTRPFSGEELVARVRLRLPEGSVVPDTVLRHGDLALDLRSRRVAVGDNTVVDLTDREATLLEVFLLQRGGDVLSRQVLFAHVWGDDAATASSNVVDVYVRYLRQKIGSRHIETVRGKGYRLAPLPADSVPADTVPAGTPPADTAGAREVSTKG